MKRSRKACVLYMHRVYRPLLAWLEPGELFGESEFASSPLIGDRWLCPVDADNPLRPDGGITKELFLRLMHLDYRIERDRRLNLAYQQLAQTGISAFRSASPQRATSARQIDLRRIDQFPSQASPEA